MFDQKVDKIDKNRPAGNANIGHNSSINHNTNISHLDTERLIVLGKLASKVAHELNNPMDGILRYINLTLRIAEQENLDKPKEYLANCRQGILRMVQVTSDLLEFTRCSYSFAEEYMELGHVIDDALKIIAGKAAGENVKVTKSLDEKIGKIRCGNLFAVFCNLIKNAYDAMPDGGELNITTRLADGCFVEIEFRDTGVGISEESNLIFEPFFTTKEVGKGTGLGLSICKEIVERYNGSISALNANDKGSIFIVRLPLTTISQEK